MEMARTSQEYVCFKGSVRLPLGIQTCPVVRGKHWQTLELSLGDLGLGMELGFGRFEVRVANWMRESCSWGWI